jgi:hypothetical protein
MCYTILKMNYMIHTLQCGLTLFQLQFIAISQNLQDEKFELKPYKVVEDT